MKKWPLKWIPPKDFRVPWYEYPGDDIEKANTVKPVWIGIDTFSTLPKPSQKDRQTQIPNTDVSWLTKITEFFQLVTMALSRVYPPNFWNGNVPKSTSG